MDLLWSKKHTRFSQSCPGQWMYCLLLDPFGKTKILHSGRGVGMGMKSSALGRISFKTLLDGVEFNGLRQLDGPRKLRFVNWSEADH